MKKLLCLLLATLMAFTLTACAKMPETTVPAADTSEAVSVIPEPAAEITSQPEEITSQPNAPPAGEAEDTSQSSSEQEQPESGISASDTSEAVSEISEPTEEINSQPEEMNPQPNNPPAGESEATKVSTSEQTKPETPDSELESTVPLQPEIDENGSYTSRDEVALYIHTYGHLPQNFITKKEAQALGWSGGSLETYAPGKCIGGSYFGNYEGLLPEKDGRSYTECDIDTLGKDSRGAKRIVFSNDGLIYYTDDHYESFTLLYGEE